MASVSMKRWQEAQEAEQLTWLRGSVDIGRVRKSLDTAIATAEWVQPDAPAGNWLVVGLSPLGISSAHFLPGAAELHSIDPLKPLPAGDWSLPEPCKALLRACEDKTTKHVGKGERIDFPDDSFAFVSIENTLDHVQDPTAVMREARRVLEPGGRLLLTVDTFSRLATIKYRLIARRRLRDSILVRAHPHRFSSDDVQRLVVDAGFTIARADLPTQVGSLAGRHYRVRLLAR
jgi:SAM-dependent methyltransferase